MSQIGRDSLKTRRTLAVGDKRYDYFSLEAAAGQLGDISHLPFSLKILLENLLRHEDGRSVKVDDLKQFKVWLDTRRSSAEIAFRPARVLMQDFTGVPAVVDLAAMREAMAHLGGNAQRINPLVPVDLVIDHSVMVDEFGGPNAFKANVDLEFERNKERYEFLRWGQNAFKNFRVVPPGTGICHQVNLEYLAQTVWTADVAGKTVAYPDTLVGTDSHTTMVNGLAVLGWGVGGIEAEAAMLGQPVSMLIPEVIGFRMTGALAEGTTATDLVLAVTQMLRSKGVVNKFVEFYGPGISHLSLPDRATIANMAPEYGATCGFFPIDPVTIGFLKFTGRDPARVALVEAYAKAQGMWRGTDTPDPIFTDTLELDVATVEPSLAGPKRPQDRVALSKVASELKPVIEQMGGGSRQVPVAGSDYQISDGDVVIAAITSCTNTSNPSVMVAAGLLARNALAKGLKAKPWVKTSLAPGSQVVTDYLEKADLQSALNGLGFDLVGYGCTTCIGNSGPLPEAIGDAVDKGDLVVGAVLSGNRNFEGRVHAQVKVNYLASPPLVVAYALAGSLKVNFSTDPIGQDGDGKPVYLRDIWPSSKEIADTVQASLTPAMFLNRYGNVFEGPTAWRTMHTPQEETYRWSSGSTYVQLAPYFEDMQPVPAPVKDVTGARVLALLADSITTDHISPAGNIRRTSPAGAYLIDRQVRPQDFNSYGARRGNHEIMMRGTFANIRIRNELAPGTEGGVTKHMPSGEVMPIYDAAMRYRDAGVPLIILAGKEYGTGSSRDWAAKGTMLLGVRAVIAESFERIHRSNLVGMGVLPLEFKDGVDRKTLKLDGSETIDVTGVESGIQPRMDVTVRVHRAGGKTDEFKAVCRIDTQDEIEYYRHGGILPYVLRDMLKAG
ncbi:MAG: aconitate hydratase AcnA [Alphaproteobacteria bacterium]|nr:aconitate hydratase AcnA [Alphaproteobacteria bacterium]